MAEGTEAATATARAGEGTALAEDTAARGGVQTGSQVAEASGTTGADATKVYRVEGEGNHRVSIGDDGSVEIPEVRTNKGQSPERNLYLNFGDEARAREFLQQRLAGGYPDNVIKSFDVPSPNTVQLAPLGVRRQRINHLWRAVRRSGKPPN